jgi:Fe-S cluster assembly protein SufD
MSSRRSRSQKNLRESISKWLVEKHAERFSNGRAVSPLSDVRVDAIRHFERLGLPGVKEEAWRFTPVVSYMKDLPDEQDVGQRRHDSVEPFLTPDLDVDLVVTVDGVYSAEHSRIERAPGVHVMALREARQRFPEVCKAHLARHAKPDSEPFVSLNTAFLEDGTFVYVEKGVRAPRPIHVVHLLSERPGTLQYGRSLFVVDERADAYVIESFRGIDPAAIFANLVTEVFVGARAHLDHYRLQGRPGASTVDTLHGYQGEQSTYRVFTFTVSGTLARNNITIVPDGAHCETYMSGLFLIQSGQHVDNHTLVDHTEPACHSNELFKGILAGSAGGVFRGMLHVHPRAQQTNAFQSNRNLLLSKDATINTQPQLEIYADDVKCSHGATTGFLDDDAIFYLRARGIPYREARLLLMHAFTAEVTDRIKIPELRDYIDDLVTRRLEEIS